MITRLKEKQKTTEIYFNKADDITTIILFEYLYALIPTLLYRNLETWSTEIELVGRDIVSSGFVF